MKRVAVVIAILMVPAWPQSTKVRSKKIGKDRSEMVLIPGGPFEMGSDPATLPGAVQWLRALYPGKRDDVTPAAFEDETPQHRVNIGPFYMDRYEVTNRQYRAFVRDTRHREPQGMAIVLAESKFSTNSAFRPWEDGNFNGDGQPVVGVSRDDARAYCSWAGKRLPSEAEWEKAARGGLTGKQFSWGDAWPPPARAGNFAEESFKNAFTEARFPAFSGYRDGAVFPTPVGRFQPNGYGLHDMIGNVSEWVEDAYGADYYRESPAENPKGPSNGDVAISRGGSWFYKWAYVLRVAKREDGPDSWRAFDQGFRCAVRK
jgi:formylglycine-generating enzyme required for sulfatase activity